MKAVSFNIADIDSDDARATLDIFIEKSRYELELAARCARYHIEAEIQMADMEHGGFTELRPLRTVAPAEVHAQDTVFGYEGGCLVVDLFAGSEDLDVAACDDVHVDWVAELAGEVEEGEDALVFVGEKVFARGGLLFVFGPHGWGLEVWFRWTLWCVFEKEDGNGRKSRPCHLDI